MARRAAPRCASRNAMRSESQQSPSRPPGPSAALWAAAHAKLADGPFSGPRIYAGRCGTRSYALASFKDRELGFQDQPERFTRRGSGHWKDRGDTGGDVYFAAPKALLRIWGLATRC